MCACECASIVQLSLCTLYAVPPPLVDGQAVNVVRHHAFAEERATEDARREKGTAQRLSVAAIERRCHRASRSNGLRLSVGAARRYTIEYTMGSCILYVITRDHTHSHYSLRSKSSRTTPVWCGGLSIACVSCCASQRFSILSTLSHLAAKEHVDSRGNACPR